MIFDSPWLEGWLARAGVPHLFPNLPLLLNSALFFFAVQVASAYWSPRLLPKQFAKLSPRTRSDWDLHFVGWVHGLISTPLALYFILHPSKELVADPIYGWSPREGIMFAISGGYFLYDFIISLFLVRSQGVAFLVHATACCFIFLKAFTPLLNGFSAQFLVWEFSTLFLHPHWFMDKLEMTGSTVQLVNGVALIGAFLSSRIIYGGYMTLVLWRALDEPRVPSNLRWGFRAANLALTCLNWSWLRLMVLSILKRFKARGAIDAATSKDERKKARKTGSNDNTGDLPPEL